MPDPIAKAIADLHTRADCCRDANRVLAQKRLELFEAGDWENTCRDRYRRRRAQGLSTTTALARLRRAEQGTIRALNMEDRTEQLLKRNQTRFQEQANNLRRMYLVKRLRLPPELQRMIQEILYLNGRY